MPAPRTAALLVVLAAIATGAPSLAGGFVMDDPALVAENPSLESVAGIPRLFVQPYWHGFNDASANYRPFALATFALERPLRGDGALGCRLTNLALHAACALCFLLLATRLLGPAAGLAAALAWTLMPVHAENLAQVVMRTTLLSALFSLVFLLGALGRKPPSGARAWGLGLAWLAALLSKEGAAFVPLGGLLLLGLLPPGERAGRVRALVLPVAAAGLAFFALRTVAVGVAGPYTTYAEQGPSLAGRLPSIVRALAWDHAVLAWPFGLSAMHPFPRPGDVPVPETALHAAFLALLAVLAWRRRGPARIGLAFFWLGLLPVSNLAISIGVERGARFLYLAAWGATLAAGPLLARAASSRAGAGALAAAGLALAALFARTCSVWSDPRAVVSDSLAQVSQDPVLRAHRIQEALSAGRFRRALREADGRLRSDGDDPGALLARGEALLALGDPRAARAASFRACETLRVRRLAPGGVFETIARSYLAEGPAALGEGIEALRALSRAHPGAWAWLGRLREAAGRLPEARAAYLESLQRLPSGRDAPWVVSRLRALEPAPARQSP